jgi:hypothetical protein
MAPSHREWLPGAAEPAAPLSAPRCDKKQSCIPHYPPGRWQVLIVDVTTDGEVEIIPQQRDGVLGAVLFGKGH